MNLVQKKIDIHVKWIQKKGVKEQNLREIEVQPNMYYLLRIMYQ